MSVITYAALCAHFGGNAPMIPIFQYLDPTVTCYVPDWISEERRVAILTQMHDMWPPLQPKIVRVSDCPVEKLCGDWREHAATEEEMHG